MPERIRRTAKREINGFFVFEYVKRHTVRQKILTNAKLISYAQRITPHTKSIVDKTNGLLNIKLFYLLFESVEK